MAIRDSDEDRFGLSGIEPRELLRRLPDKTSTASPTGPQQVFLRPRRRWPIGFGPNTVLPQQSIVVESQPRCVFRAEKIYSTLSTNTTDPTALDDLFIVGFFVGQKAQIKLPVSMRDLLSSIFLASELMVEDCQPTQFISFQVENRGRLPHVWSLTILGSAIEP